MFEHAMERAFVARLAIGLLSLYLVVAGYSFNGVDDALFGIGWLDTQTVFTLAGVLGFPMIFWPKTQIGLVPWLAMLGLACVGRSMTILFVGEYPSDLKLRSLGWFVTWLSALVAVLQIQASEILRRREAQWTG